MDRGEGNGFFGEINFVKWLNYIHLPSILQFEEFEKFQPHFINKIFVNDTTLI